MKRTLLSLLCLIFITQVATAQFPFGGASKPSIKGKITGKLIDSLTALPVGYATVALYKVKGKTAIDGTLSEEDGGFKLEDIKTGKYRLEFSFLGYETKVLEIETTLKDPDYDFNEVMLVPSINLLDEVEVTEKRALFENRADKIVFNAEDDSSLAGTDATAVLRKVPLLTVDLNGNVSLRGSQNVRILINGKPSGMFSNNVADALKMFPADQIKKVEVITSPSAKYDGEGSAGIINIITKKENIEGVAGSINASIGNLQNSLFTNLNAGKGRFGLSSSAAVFYSVPVDGTSFFERTENIDGLERIYTQSGVNNTSRLGGNGNISMFYDFNGFHSINSSVNFRGFGFDTDGDQMGTLIDPILKFENQFTRTNEGDNFFGGFDWNTDYTMKFENQKDRELVFAFQYSKDNNNQDFTVAEEHTFLDFLDRSTDIYNDGDNNEYTMQVDYTHPFKKGRKLEVGVKSVIRDIASTYTSRFADPDFFYDQDVYAGYASFSFNIAKKYSVIAGARYESTEIGGRFANGDEPFANTYDNVLPSITVSRALPKFRTIKLSYTSRIQRPSLFYINPFNNNVDQLNLTIGNPSLNPELVDQLELSYNTNIAGFTIFASAYYKHTSAIIESVLAVQDEGVTVNTFSNIGTNDAFGLNLFTSKTINKFTIRSGGNIFSYNAQGVVNGQERSRSTYEYNLFANGEYSFSGTLKADFFGFFRSPQRTLQGDNASFSIYGMGIRKEFKNWSLGINLIEPFSGDKEFNSKITGQTNGNAFTQINNFTIPFRSIGANFRYKFGSVDFKKRKSKIKNDDQKDGEGQGGGVGGGQQGGGVGQ